MKRRAYSCLKCRTRLRVGSPNPYGKVVAACIGCGATYWVRPNGSLRETTPEERREAPDGTPLPIHTGVEFPNGTDTHDGKCSRCGIEGAMTDIRLTHPSMPPRELTNVCAECMADFAVGSPIMGMGTAVFIRARGGWAQIGAQLAARH